MKDCDNDLSFSIFYQCVGSCNTKDFFNTLCVISDEYIEAKNYMVNTINNEISNYMNSILNKDLKISYEHEIYHITSTTLQKTNEYNDEATIILGS